MTFLDIHVRVKWEMGGKSRLYPEGKPRLHCSDCGGVWSMGGIDNYVDEVPGDGSCEAKAIGADVRGGGR